MPNLKTLIPLAAVVALAALPAAPLAAHPDKPLDRNGGHWDYFGDYHCHLSGCRIAPSRYSFARTNRLSNNDQDLFYIKEDWPHWMLVGQCQDMRTEILVATSEVPVTYSNPRQCEVREGKWTDPYTGEQFTRAAQLEIDHIVPPVYANASNGYQWDDQKRMQFANDPINLIAVSRDVHRKKRDRGIGNWQPPEESFHCEYAAAWRDVSEKYDLDLFSRDRSRMNRILEDCDIPEGEIEEYDTGDTDVEIRANGIPLPL